MMPGSRFISASEQTTRAIGRKLGMTLQPGSIVSLRGSLGSGKTVFTKGIAEALNITENIISPTYTLIQEYCGTLELHHLDLYRISGIEDFEMLGAEELLYTAGVSVIEWSEIIEELLPEFTIRVTLEIDSDQKRLISIDGAAL
jgi:tRNA threonylcarbamoyladenosine biosynthesis protein TsaE